MLRQWSPYVLILPMLLMWHCTTHGHPIQHQCYLRDDMQRQWSTGDLPRVLRIWESVFYSRTFFTLHYFLLSRDFPGAGSSSSKLAGFYADLRNIAPAWLFAWITSVHKKTYMWWVLFKGERWLVKEH